MEYADSGDLFQKIAKHQKRNTLMSEHFIWNVFTQITQGLRVLHELNVLHRDMKSANVFLNRDGSVKLGDMNVSKETKNGLLYTQTGTPYYASPEVWQDKPYNMKSDIWSLGCVLYEACTLKPPFRAEDMQGLYEKVTKGEYSPIYSNYSKDLNWVLRKLLQIDPNKRPNCVQILSMPAVIKRLHKVRESSSPNELIKEIKLKDQENLSQELPVPNYNYRHKSEMPSISKSPSKLLKDEGNKSFAVHNRGLYPNHYKAYREIIKESYGILKLPKANYSLIQSPLPIRKLKEIEEQLSLPKSLPAHDRLKKLRNAYLGKSFKLYIN